MSDCYYKLLLAVGDEQAYLCQLNSV